MPKQYKKFEVIFPAVQPEKIEIIAADHKTAHAKAKNIWKSKYPVLPDTVVRHIEKEEVFYKEQVPSYPIKKQEKDQHAREE
mgnify:CR=1 FL=1